MVIFILFFPVIVLALWVLSVALWDTCVLPRGCGCRELYQLIALQLRSIGHCTSWVSSEVYIRFSLTFIRPFILPFFISLLYNMYV